MGEIVSNKLDSVLNKPQTKSSDAKDSIFKKQVLENKGTEIRELLKTQPLNEPYQEKKVKINDDDICRSKFMDVISI